MKSWIKKIFHRIGCYEIIHHLNLKLFYQNKRNYIDQHNKLLTFFSSYIKENDLCFDVGANEGALTELFLELGAKVIAIEPQRSCMKYLKYKFKRNNMVILIEKALGDREGEAELFLSNNRLISSLSKEWMGKVAVSGRVGGYIWERTENVQVTTLDNLIKEFGQPAFIKIDVEGYEYEVLKGLSRPVKTMSLEFTPEFIEATLKCIDYLCALGKPKFNFCYGQEYQLVLEQWADGKYMSDLLNQLPQNALNGDLYVSFET